MKEASKKSPASASKKKVAKAPAKRVSAATKKPAAKSAVKSTVKKSVKKPAGAKKVVRKSSSKSPAKKSVKRAAPRKVVKSQGKGRGASVVENDSAQIAASIDDPTFDFVKKCFTALDDKKAEDIKVLDVRGKSPITNYFVIATATSAPHMKALAGELDKTLKENGVKSIGRDYNTGSGWMVVDAFDFMAHIFLPEQRGLYGIESLWKDAQEIKMQ